MKTREIGVWLDYNSAIIIDHSNSETASIEIESNIDPYHLKGGSAAKVPWGAVDTVSESKLLNKRNQQSNRYYKAIAQYINAQDKVLIFGPAEAKLGLDKFLQNNKIAKVVSVETVKYMTLKQKEAYVRNHYTK